ncbi:MAG: WecB/TagA/CpsF family glycosyltransferase [Lachnospiraceae bacterium]|nr:WecB/TagA/CpsF family glycosyltransferase [Lachnospiraceae bacterium]
MEENCRVLATDYRCSDIDTACGYVTDNLYDLRGGYICFSNVHTTVMAYEDPKYREILASAGIVFPDGSPIVNEMRKKGYKNAERIAGPDFMARMFELTKDKDIRHFFYGSKQETLDKLSAKLSERYRGIKIAGMYSPPFRELTEEEDEETVRMINDARPDIVWVGLGAPKQEKWMNEHKGKINAVMAGVGAGFDFHAGTVKRAPLWMQKTSLEWLYRLIQDPGRLFKRYMVTNSRFIYYTKIKKR